MKKIVFALIIISFLCSHTMFLKLDSYFLEPNSSVALQLFNGTFEKSENIIDRDRMLDASITANGERKKVLTSQWEEKDSITVLNFKTGPAGTYVAGISTKARSLAMTPEAFNNYLDHEGIYDMLKWRKDHNTLEMDAVEKYSKHVKTIFQVGDNTTDDWQTNLGYPIEFIPLTNPYTLHTGDSLEVKLLVNGKPLTNQLVYADYKADKNAHSHDSTNTEEEHGHSHDNAKEGAHGHSHDDEKEEHGHSHDDEREEEHGHSHDDEKTESGHSHDTDTKHAHDGTEPHNHSNGENKKIEKHSHDNGSKHPTEAAVDIKDSHTHTTGQKLRTNAEGIVKAHLSADGVWYLQTIHLVTAEEEGLTHESNWATLTFQVTHKHGDDTHSHDNEHDHEQEDNSTLYVFLLGSILLVGILFLWFNKKKATSEDQ